MKSIYLLGDSIIDNGAYVGIDEKDVESHLNSMYKEDPKVNINNRAVDGHTMRDLLDTQLSDAGLNEATHIVMSIGGNDLLQNISFLQMTSKLSEVMNKDARIGKWGVRELNPSRNKVFEETYFEIIKPFNSLYETIVEKLSNYRAKLLLCTVYEGDLFGSDEFKNVFYSSKTMVSIFNDLVYKSSSKFKTDVLELRNIFVSSEDYANPIEPSHIGGEKLAKSIVEWVDNG